MEEIADKVAAFFLTAVVLGGAVFVGAILGSLIPIPFVGPALGGGVAFAIAIKLILPKIEQFFSDRALARRTQVPSVTTFLYN